MLESDKCKGQLSNGQPCFREIVKNADGVAISEYCLAHGGFHDKNRYMKQVKFNYNLDAWNEKIREKATSPQVKNLREEIGVLRVLLETRLRALNPENEFDVIRSSGPIGDLVIKIEKLVSSCHKLEEKLGITLDKTKVESIARQIIEIIGSNLQELEVSEEIAGQFLTKVVCGIEQSFCGDNQERTAPQKSDDV